MKVYILWYKRRTLFLEYEPPKVIEGLYAKIEDAHRQAEYLDKIENCDTWIEQEVVYGAD